MPPQNFRYSCYKTLLELHFRTKFKHLGSSLSCLDTVAYLWSTELDKHDSFLLSKGHAVSALYTVFYQLGYLNRQELFSFHLDGTRLGAHPSRHIPNLIPFPTGSLGHGLSIAAGMAQSYFFTASEKTLPRVFCLLSDGECNVGQTWEAAAYAAANKLSNLIVLIDRNRLQAFGTTKAVLGDSTTLKRWQSFGFNALEVNGHDWKALAQVLKKLNQSQVRRPTAIVLNTIKGFGVSFMENELRWHYDTMTEAEFKMALEEVEKFKTN